ncbi:hypothetical protein QFZ24_006611 [Streptomyces phaeochromogenes]|jgi:hypothetical protein|uniref:hypothetical protein n=1 Tax=Streptomyces phaeochromogenes TaxID=1923 RepID=UPI00278D0CB6|nr:hypothetical protein [Streptomyces phaeochromogenes]MDQ0952688.1 hypothetical protein [Streptomyces phaeochromogenes]
MDTAQQPYVRDDAAVRTWQLVREPFTARAWGRVAYALPAVPVGPAVGPAGRWQRGLVRRCLDVERSGSPRGAGRGGSPEGPGRSTGPGSSPDLRVAGCPDAGSRDARP